jgi:hypothetical protein
MGIISSILMNVAAGGVLFDGILYNIDKNNNLYGLLE